MAGRAARSTARPTRYSASQQVYKLGRGRIEVELWRRRFDGEDGPSALPYGRFAGRQVSRDRSLARPRENWGQTVLSATTMLT